MPINTSMNRWSRIASNMDIESVSSSGPFDTFSKQSAKRSLQCKKSKETEVPEKTPHGALPAGL